MVWQVLADDLQVQSLAGVGTTSRYHSSSLCSGSAEHISCTSSRQAKHLTLGGRSRLLPLRHDSCDLQRPRPIFENYHVIFTRARNTRFSQTVF